MYCHDATSQFTYVPDYEHDTVLSSIEATSAVLGTHFNGDARLFAVEVGYVGYYGQWLHGFEAHPELRCPLPSNASASRIVSAVVSAFPASFVLMPRPWNAPEFNFAAYPNIGIITPEFPSSFFLSQLSAMDLSERWKRAPFVAFLTVELQECWFDEFPVDSCAALGVATEVQSYASAVAAAHPSMVHRGALYMTHAGSTEAALRIKQRYLATGALLHVASVTQQLGATSYAICVTIDNIGSAPFHTPPGMALELVVEVAGVRVVLQGGGGVAVLPGGRGVFSGEVGAGVLGDECGRYGGRCGEGQRYAMVNTFLSFTPTQHSCTDPDTSVHSQGDWHCVCPDSTTRERARPATCGATTAYRRDAETYTTTTTTSDTIGTLASLGLTDASYTLSAWVYLAVCTESYDCASNTTASNPRDTTRGTLFGTLSATPPGPHSTLSVIVGHRRWVVSHSTVHCSTTTAGVINAWTHLSAVYNHTEQTLSIYTDGSLDTMCTAFSPMLGTGPFSLGSGAEDNPRPFVGGVHTVQIFQEALSSTQIADLAVLPAVRGTPSARISLETAFGQRKVRFATSMDNVNVNASADGSFSVVVPPQTEPSNENCLTWVDPPASPLPESALWEPAELALCGAAVLKGWNGTVPSSMEGGSLPSGVLNTIESACDGDYVLAMQPAPHYRRASGGRELWPSSSSSSSSAGLFHCTLEGGGVDAPRLPGGSGSETVAWWQTHFLCSVNRTDAPPTEPPATLPPGETAGPTETPTYSPRTYSPPRPITLSPPLGSDTHSPGETWVPLGRWQTAAPPECEVSGLPAGVAVEVVHRAAPAVVVREVRIRWSSTEFDWAAVGFGVNVDNDIPAMSGLEMYAVDISHPQVVSFAKQTNNARPTEEANLDTTFISLSSSEGMASARFTVRLQDAPSPSASLRIATAMGSGMIQSESWAFHGQNAGVTMHSAGGCTVDVGTTAPETAVPEPSVREIPSSGEGVPISVVVVAVVCVLQGACLVWVIRRLMRRRREQKRRWWRRIGRYMDKGGGGEGGDVDTDGAGSVEGEEGDEVEMSPQVGDGSPSGVPFAPRRNVLAPPRG